MAIEDNNWVDKSIPIENLEIEFYFLMPENFYVGERYNIKQFRNSEYFKPLQLPNFPRAESTFAGTKEVISHEKELVSYYKQAVEMAAFYKKSFDDISLHFKLELKVWKAENGIQLSFPFYQNYSDLQPFFTWAKSSENNSKFLDDSPEWKFEAICLSNQFHFLICDYENNESNNISTEKEPFLRKLIEAEERAISIIKNLNAEMGVDVWTSQQLNPMFGNSTWKPKKLPNSMPLIIRILILVLEAGVSFYNSTFARKAILISIIGICIASSITINYLKDIEIQNIERTHTYNIQIERAAVKNFESVKKILKIAPGAILVDNKLSEFVIGKEINVYSCKLPKFTIINKNVIFKGDPTFEIKSLLKKPNSNDRQLSIEEIEKDIEEARKNK